MNQLQIFSNPEFGDIRVIAKDRQPWFVAADICKALDLTNVTVSLQRLDDDERSKFNLGRQGETNVVNEYGLYSLILCSRKPEAKEFKRWITHEVLPQIRQTGGYIPSTAGDTDDDIMAKALLIAQRKIQLKDKAIAEKERQLAEQKPKVEFADHVATSTNSLLVREVAKIVSKDGIKIGERNLYKKLREWGWVFKSSCEATQKAIESGYMEVSETVKQLKDDKKITFKTSRITGKGQLRIVQKLKSELMETEKASA